MTPDTKGLPSVPGPKGAPSQLRIRLGMALRDLRIAAGLSQAKAAAVIGAKQAKLSNLEGAVTDRIKMGELNALLDTYGVALDSAQADEFRLWARSPYNGVGVWLDTAPGAVWWQRFREVEHLARVFNAAHLQAIDGLLQHPGYMRRQFELDAGPNVEARVQARLTRQKAMFDREDPAYCTFVLDAACLYKTMGQPPMMVQQIRHLLELSEHPYIAILIVEFDAIFPTSTYGFSMLQFDSAVMRDFVSVEYEVGSATIDDEIAVRRYHRRWDSIRSAALSEHGSRIYMRNALGRMEQRAKGLTEL